MVGDSLTRNTKKTGSGESLPGTLTPLMRQYQRIKMEHQDELLLFRLGDFYESFGEDAKLAADILNITLTKKHVAKGKTLPLAGIPYHSLEKYLSTLIISLRPLILL